MLRIIWVAAFALLWAAVIIPSPALADEANATSATADASADASPTADASADATADAAADDDPPAPQPPEDPCKGLSGNDLAQCKVDSSHSKVILENSGRISNNGTAIESLTATVTGNGERITTLESTKALNSKWGGWHFGAMLTSSGAVMTGSDETFSPLRVDGLVRYLSVNHVGFEMTAGVGGWLTEDLFPFMFAVSPAFVTGGPHWSASVGPEYSVLQHPIVGEDTAHLVNLKVTGEFRPGEDENLMVRIFLSPNLYNEGKRSGGLHIGGAIGYHF
jgi:hypothetical protein